VQAEDARVRRAKGAGTGNGFVPERGMEPDCRRQTSEPVGGAVVACGEVGGREAAAKDVEGGGRGKSARRTSRRIGARMGNKGAERAGANNHGCVKGSGSARGEDPGRTEEGGTPGGDNPKRVGTRPCSAKGSTILGRGQTRMDEVVSTGTQGNAGPITERGEQVRGL
jgi:hypothetical protein